MKKVRPAVTRVARDHQFVLMRESDASPELVAELNAISERWRGKDPERGFTMALSQDVTGDNPEIRAGDRPPRGAHGGLPAPRALRTARTPATRST